MQLQSIEELVKTHKPVNFELQHTRKVFQLAECCTAVAYQGCFHVFTGVFCNKMTGGVNVLRRTVNSANCLLITGGKNTLMMIIQMIIRTLEIGLLLQIALVQVSCLVLMLLDLLTMMV